MLKQNKILNLEKLAEIASRTQEDQELAKKVFLELLQKMLNEKGDIGVKKTFKEMTDLDLKTIIKGKYMIIYDNTWSV